MAGEETQEAPVDLHDQDAFLADVSATLAQAQAAKPEEAPAQEEEAPISQESQHEEVATEDEPAEEPSEIWAKYGYESEEDFKFAVEVAKDSVKWRDVLKKATEEIQREKKNLADQRQEMESLYFHDPERAARIVKEKRIAMGLERRPRLEEEESEDDEWDLDDGEDEDVDIAPKKKVAAKGLSPKEVMKLVEHKLQQHEQKKQKLEYQRFVQNVEKAKSQIATNTVREYVLKNPSLADLGSLLNAGVKDSLAEEALKGNVPDILASEEEYRAFVGSLVERQMKVLQRAMAKGHQGTLQKHKQATKDLPPSLPKGGISRAPSETLKENGAQKSYGDMTPDEFMADIESTIKAVQASKKGILPRFKR